jgi:hypothetical protein
MPFSHRYEARHFAPLLLLIASCGTADRSDQMVASNKAPESVSKLDSKAAEASRVTGQKDMTLKAGGKVCKIDFVYSGYGPDSLFWDGENCNAVSATMVGRDFLEQFDKWERLDSAAQKHIMEMPGGKVLYVEGEFTASVYPVGATGDRYEIAVAD